MTSDETGWTVECQSHGPLGIAATQAGAESLLDEHDYEHDRELYESEASS